MLMIVDADTWLMLILVNCLPHAEGRRILLLLFHTTHTTQEQHNTQCNDMGAVQQQSLQMSFDTVLKVQTRFPFPAQTGWSGVLLRSVAADFWLLLEKHMFLHKKCPQNDTKKAKKSLNILFASGSRQWHKGLWERGN